MRWPFRDTLEVVRSRKELYKISTHLFAQHHHASGRCGCLATDSSASVFFTHISYSERIDVDSHKLNSLNHILLEYMSRIYGSTVTFSVFGRRINAITASKDVLNDIPMEGGEDGVRTFT